MTLFCRDCVVAVKVDTRDGSAPADAGGCIVVRLAFERLLVRETSGLDGASPLLFCCPAPFIMLVMRPGPTLFLGGLEAAGPKVVDWVVLD